MRHNKKRNTALLYEFLIRHISKSLTQNRESEAKKAVALLKKHYKAGPLKEELDLFNCITKTRVQTPQYAAKLIREVLTRARKIDSKKLDERKSLLIKEINKTFDAKSFYAHKIPEYVLYASLQTLLNNATGHKKLHESVNRIQLEERIVQHLLSPKKTDGKLTIQETMKLDPQFNNAVYQLVIKKFKAKYQESLTEGQYMLLSKYARALMSETKTIFTNAAAQAIEEVRNSLALVRDKEIAKDSDLMKKVSECRKRVDALMPESMDAQSLVQLLQFMQLANEVSA